jgi:hypothetical protein
VPPRAVEIPRFGGLDLRDDPQEVSLGSAIDGLNVDMSVPGRLLTRSGYAKFTAGAAAASYSALMPFYRSTALSSRQIAASKGANSAANAGIDVLNTSGGLATGGASISTLNFPHHAMAALGTPSQAYLYAFPFAVTASGPIASSGAYWLGAGAWTSPGSFSATAAAVQKSENRVMIALQVAAGISDTVGFSEAGNPLTGYTSNTVSVTPGDGEWLINFTSYRELVLCFKQTKFFVFYGNGTSSTGTLVPNYRTVDAGVGCVSPRGAVASPEGVYFLDRTGVYLTTGSIPTKVSGPLDPLFGKGALPSCYQGLAINWTAIEWATLDYYNGSLFLSVPTGASTSNDTTFVYDVTSKQWMAWNTKVNGMTSFRIGDQEELLFSLASGSNDIVRMGQPGTYTTDAGASFTGRYRTGYWNPGAPGAESWVREVLLDGTGAVIVKTAVNDAVTLGTGQAVTLGTAPAIAQGRDRRGLRGRTVSYEFSGTAPWSLSRVQPILWGQRTTGEKA